MNYIDKLLERNVNEQMVENMLPKTAKVTEDKKKFDKNKKVYAYLRQNYPRDTLFWVNDADWELKDVPLSSIQMDRRPGGAREQDKVKGIAEAVKNGEIMDPVVLVETPNGIKLKIADGYHRTLGIKKANKVSIKAWVGKVKSEKGPWDKEMHEKKLNVGKTAEEVLEEMEKEAFVGAAARLGGTMAKGLLKSTVNAGKTLSGTNIIKATANKNNVIKNPNVTKKEVTKAKRGVGKEVAKTLGGWGALGVGAVGTKVADDYNQQRKENINGNNIKPIQNL